MQRDPSAGLFDLSPWLISVLEPPRFSTVATADLVAGGQLHLVALAELDRLQEVDARMPTVLELELIQTFIQVNGREAAFTRAARGAIALSTPRGMNQRSAPCAMHGALGRLLATALSRSSATCYGVVLGASDLEQLERRAQALTGELAQQLESLPFPLALPVRSPSRLQVGSC